MVQCPNVSVIGAVLSGGVVVIAFPFSKPKQRVKVTNMSDTAT
jgi:hypothetical protein